MLTIEEITLMKIYTELNTDRQVLISNLKAVMPHFTEEEQEMKDLTEGVIRKLTAMNDKAFWNIDFSVALDEEAPPEDWF